MGRYKEGGIYPVTAGEIISSEWSHPIIDVLLSVLMRLISLADFFACSCVCKDWRSISKDVERRFIWSQPPILLCTNLCTKRSPFNGRTMHVGGLYSLAENRFIKPIILPDFQCIVIGFSEGFLIFVDADSLRKPLLLNPFTRSELRFPKARYDLYSAICLFPPVSKYCLLLAFNHPRHAFQYCRLGDRNWSVHRCSPDDKWWINSAVVCKEKVYFLTIKGRIGKLDFDPLPSITFLEVQDLTRYLLDYEFTRRTMLTVIGRYLLVLAFNRQHCQHRLWIDIIRLDISSLKWERWKRLRGCSLFLSHYTARRPNYFASVTPVLRKDARSIIYVAKYVRTSLGIHRYGGDGLLLDSQSLPIHQSRASASSFIWVFPKLCVD